MITKNTKQYEILMTTKTDTRSLVHAAKAAKAIRRRMLRQQDEIWITYTDMLVINRVADILRLGTHRDPFSGGSALCGSKMAVTPTMLRGWLVG